MSDLAVGDSCCMWEETGPASSRGTSKKGTSELFCWCAEAAELCWAASAAIAAMCRLAAACRWKFGKKGGQGPAEVGASTAGQKGGHALDTGGSKGAGLTGASSSGVSMRESMLNPPFFLGFEL